MTYGFIHSFESFGAVDGPGVRFIVFLSGCPLRCLYCHNPDAWDRKNAQKLTPDEVFEKIKTYKSFIEDGGVTISGGEPLMQPEFCSELIDLCKTENLHVAIDTSGYIPLEKSAEAIKKADLILLDIKEVDEEDCITLTGQSNKNTIKTLEFCEEHGISVWIRHVLLPNYTLKEEKLKKLAEFLKPFKCIQKVEVLPYHTMGKFKWEQLGIEYKLEGINPPDNSDVEKAKEILGIK